MLAGKLGAAEGNWGRETGSRGGKLGPGNWKPRRETGAGKLGAAEGNWGRETGSRGGKLGAGNWKPRRETGGGRETPALFAEHLPIILSNNMCIV